MARSTGQDLALSVAVEKRDLLARLLARLAHEIRNPLSSLDIHVQLLDEDLSHASPATRERLEIVRGELTRLEGIVKRFLRLASPSALELGSVVLGELVGHVCRLLEPEASARQIRILTELSPNLPVLHADGGQLTQVLLNLLINALQAVNLGGCVTIRGALAGVAGYVSVEVQDSGPGVPEEKLTALFEPYFTTKDEGSGLGLWIAQQIVVAHGGTLEVTNAREGGAIFRVNLPVSQPVRTDG